MTDNEFVTRKSAMAAINIMSEYSRGLSVSEAAELLVGVINQPVQPPFEWQSRCGSEWRRIDPPKGETLEQRVAYLRGIKQKDGRPAYEIRVLGVVQQTSKQTESTK